MKFIEFEIESEQGEFTSTYNLDRLKVVHQFFELGTVLFKFDSIDVEGFMDYCPYNFHRFLKDDSRIFCIKAKLFADKKRKTTKESNV